MGFRIDFIRAYSLRDIRQELYPVLEKYQDLLPSSKTASILLKPNLNSNMNALTGNTTDLRLLAAVIEFIKGKGYNNITIGEGTNSGYYRNNINVISRTKVDRLAKYYGVKVVDFNHARKVEIDFADGVKASVAKECFEADFFINLPKLKTHFEVGMSVCLKSLMGCLVGQENKKKTHKNLSRNILNINRRVKPQLHIVDALIAMEGLGPTRGTPVNTGLIIVGTDPYLVDLACARIADFDYRKIKTLKLAEDEGILTQDYHQFIKSLDLSAVTRKFQEPKANPLVSFIHHPKRQRYFLALRNTPFFNYLCSTGLGGKILFGTGLRQDNFIAEEMIFEGFSFNRNQCRAGCTKCADYCPMGLKLPREFDQGSQGCIGCLYCFLVCPGKAIEFKGRLGFMAEQLKQYEEITRRIS
ncbi:MAG: DUF362 domain-containing protein [Candidatus Schekmanbacteria bacterium]|nr:DUF362 domain-containing protein [Candidatus Schekmanbacteria bacterium]